MELGRLVTVTINWISQLGYAADAIRIAFAIETRQTGGFGIDREGRTHLHCDLILNHQRLFGFEVKLFPKTGRDGGMFCLGLQH